ncbi:MAG TPA: cytochrome b/b6 domain-containing protein [Cellvibrio sp.]|nr:cytochrome b/b6 domain-containing protein [Cellvibrio sp.]
MNQPAKKPLDLSPLAEQRTVKVWDIPLRIFHWSLVILFAVAYITNWLGTDYFTYHLWSGYAIIVLVSFRILWGIVGTYHARFINFVRNPVATAKYALSVFKRKDKHYAGHNPLGAVMVVALLLSILVQAVTGLFTNDEIFNLGPLYGYISNDLSLTLTSLHRQLFYWILAAVALHILAVVVHVVFKRENIIKSMFSGKKQGSDLASEKSIGSSRIWLALIILVILSLALAWVIYAAPEAISEY